MEAAGKHAEETACIFKFEQLPNLRGTDADDVNDCGTADRSFEVRVEIGVQQVSGVLANGEMHTHMMLRHCGSDDLVAKPDICHVNAILRPCP